MGELEKDEIYDLTIIGAGCAGLFAANYAGLRGMKAKIIDYLPKSGGTVSVFYPEKTIYDIGGIPMITGEKLMDQLLEQAKMYSPTFVFEQEITDITQNKEGIYILSASNGVKHYTRTVLLAVGAGTFKIRYLRINGSLLQEGKHVHYEPGDISRFVGKRVAVYGGLSAAVKRATDLSKIAEKVYLIHNSEKFNALDEEMELLAKSSVHVKTPCNIKDIRGNQDALEAVVIFNSKNETDEVIGVDHLIISHGYQFDLDAVKNWGFALENRRIPVTDKMETVLPGVYAAGDIAGYANKWRLISSAFTEAITAVNSAKKYIDPSAPAQVYSTILRK
ncbi:MAG: NAD(P)/FAD-dependent oxidoreductase [Tuberibacillus sp.]